MVKKRKKLHEFRNPLRIIIFSKKKKYNNYTGYSNVFLYIETSYLQKIRSIEEPDGVNNDIYVTEGF